MDINKPRLKRFIFTIDHWEYVRLEEVCQQLDISIAQFLRVLIREKINEILGEDSSD